MAAKKKSGLNDIGKGIKAAAGATARTLYSNPGNKNQASNLDKWLKGGKYKQRPGGQLVKDVGKAADWALRKATPLPDRKKKSPKKSGGRPSGKK